MVEPLLIKSQTNLQLMAKQLVDSKSDEPFDEDNIKRLKQSMREIGFTSPVLVYSPQPSEMMLVSGRHRRRAALELGIEKIPCILLTFVKPGYQDVSRDRIDAWHNATQRDLTAREIAFRTDELARVVEAEKEAEENEFRSIDQPKLSARGRKGEGRPKEVGSTRIVAAELGISRPTVMERRKIATLPDEVLDAAEAAGVTQHVKLYQLARVPEEHRIEAIQALAESKNNSGDAAKTAQKFGAHAGLPPNVPRTTAKKPPRGNAPAVDPIVQSPIDVVESKETTSDDINDFLAIWEAASKNKRLAIYHKVSAWKGEQ